MISYLGFQRKKGFFCRFWLTFLTKAPDPKHLYIYSHFSCSLFYILCRLILTGFPKYISSHYCCYCLHFTLYINLLCTLYILSVCTSFRFLFLILTNFFTDYKVECASSLFVCPSITQEPLDRFATNFDWVTRQRECY